MLSADQNMLCPSGKRPVAICENGLPPLAMIESPLTTATLKDVVSRAYQSGTPLGYEFELVPKPLLAPADSPVETLLVPSTDPTWIKNYSYTPAKPAALIMSFLERWKLTEIVAEGHPLTAVEKAIESFRSQAMAELSASSAAYLSRVVDTLKKPLWLALPKVHTPVTVVDMMFALNVLYVFSRVFDSFGEIIAEENARVVASYMNTCFWGQVTQRRLSFKNETTGALEFVWSNPMTYLDWYIGEGIIWCDTVKQALENVNKGTQKIVKGAKDLIRVRLFSAAITVLLILLIALAVYDLLGSPSIEDLPDSFYKFTRWVKSLWS